MRAQEAARLPSATRCDQYTYFPLWLFLLVTLLYAVFSSGIINPIGTQGHYTLTFPLF